MDVARKGGINQDRQGFLPHAERAAGEPTNFLVQMKDGGLALLHVDDVGLNGKFN